MDVAPLIDPEHFPAEVSVMHRHRSVVAFAALLALVAGTRLGAQGARPATVPGTLVMAVGQEPAMPIPVIGSRTQADADVADQLFLRLGGLDPTLRTTGDNALQPELARSWKRVDSLTIVYELDPRAKWHDGTAVTSDDVLFAWKLMNTPSLGWDMTSLEPIAAVEAVGPRAVRVRFKRAFPEQLYLAGFNLLPMPAHLLAKVPADSIATSDFAKRPIGNGPYRYERRVPGQFVELRADPAFFLGKPGIARVVVRFVEDPNARLNLLMSGETDLLENVPLANLEQLKGQPQLRTVTVANSILLYALFNSRDPADTAKPHPIFADVRVREALTLALDRQTMAQSVFGKGVGVPDAAQSQIWGWITPAGLTGAKQDVARAKTLLAQAGWRDSDGDGTLDRNGQPLRFTVLTTPSGLRRGLALQAQAMWKAIGVQMEFEPVEGAVYTQRRNAGKFDIDLAGASQDPTPSSLVQSWSCATVGTPRTSNVGHWCDPTFDQLLRAAQSSAKPVPAWGRVLARQASQHPAAFLASPVNTVALHQRFTNVTIWPAHGWRSLWHWRVRPEAALPRDR